MNPVQRAETHSNFESSLSQSLALVHTALQKKDRLIDEAVFEGEKTLFDKLAKAKYQSPTLDAILTDYSATLFDSSSHERAEVSRKKAAEAAGALAACVWAGSRVEQAVRQAIASLLAQERSGSVRQALERAEQCLHKSG